MDVYGRVYKSSFKASEGRFSIIWIPVHKMEIGDTFDKSIVLKRDRWKKWEVLVIKPNNLPMQKYYEVNTGFLVGIRYSGILARGGIGELVLRDTNADIPVN